MMQRDALSPRVSERTARKIGRISSMDTLQEVVDAEELDKPTPCAEADEAMVNGNYRLNFLGSPSHDSQ